MSPLSENDVIYIKNIKGNKTKWLEAWYAMREMHKWEMATQEFFRKY